MRYRSRVGHWLDRVLSGGLGKQLLIYAGVVLVLFLLLWCIAVLIHIPIQSEKAEGFGDFWTMLFFFYDGGLEGTLPNNRWFVYLVNLLGSIVMGGILIAAITNFLQNHTTKAEEGLLRYRMPVYIIYHTDFSSGRKEMIKRDMLYSDDEQQIHDLFATEIADNIKKGWEEVR